MKLAFVKLLAIAGFLFAVSTSVLAQPAEPYRPLVFVPGILGSELLDETGEVVWGGLQSFRRFADLEITEAGPVKPLHVGGLVRRVSILGPLWTIHQYDGLLKTLKDLNYREGETLFVFPYDWRYSNFVTAQKLKSYIEAQPKLQNQQFDILAHSMGGLVSRIYMQTLGGEPRVKRFISLGTPYQGAMNSLATMSGGWGEFQNFIAGGIDTIRRVIFSFPSLYELFPSYDNCCRLGSETAFAAFDPTDMTVWNANDWIPPEHRGVRLALVQKSLNDSARLRSLMREPLPGNVETTLIAGDRLGTYLYLYVDPNDRRWNKWRFSKNRGDGTVPLWSAANASLADSLPAFVDHATIFDDKWIVNKLQRMLNKNGRPPPVSGPSTPLVVTRSGDFVEISLVEAAFEPPIVIKGGQVQLTLSVSFIDDVAADAISPALSLETAAEKRPLLARNTTTSTDLARHVLRFVTSIEPELAGPHSVRISIPGVGTYTRDLLVIDSR